MTPYQAKYLAHELTKHGPTDSIEKFAGTLADAKVDMNPHQVEAALFAFKSPLSKGAILADEVGLGKTIEAGIVLSQFWAEGKRRILLLVPASLRKQWQNELREKFYLPSRIIEGPSFNRALNAGSSNPFDTSGPEGPEIVIASQPFAAGKDEYLLRTSWDLVVIDEAHRLRNVHNTNNVNAKKLRTALRNCRKILLTATPLQNNLLELYGLVSFIDEHAFGEKRAFSARYNLTQTAEAYEDLKRRLQPLCHRTLRRQVLEYIRYTDRSALTQDFLPTNEEQALYELVSEYLRREDLYAIPTAQRKLITLVLRKLLASSSFAIAGALDSMHRRLLRLLEEDEDLRQESLADDIDSDTDGGFGETADEWADDWEDRVLSAEDRAALEREIEELAGLSEQATAISENAKGEALLSALENGFQAMNRNGAADKAIIFTESRRTQHYLVRRLTEAGYGDDLVLFNGSNSDRRSREIYAEWKEANLDTDRLSGSRTADTRQALVDYFRDSARVMIATEAAAEGINLQFCSLVINYDLPWNPQRIEQRIGRCHRYGQRHDVVVINFLNRANAADQRVHDLLAEKLKLFDGIFGSSDEVLGMLDSGVDFEKRVLAIYQNCRAPEEIQQSFDTLQKELEDQITAKLADTRTSLLENFDTEVVDRLRHHQIDGDRYLNRIQSALWELTRHILAERAMFDPGAHAFTLANPPYPDTEIPLGRYELSTGSGDPGDAHRYRLHHPLARKVIAEAKRSETPLAHLQFDYSEWHGQNARLEPLVGSSGALSLEILTVIFAAGTGRETREDHLLATAFRDDGDNLDPDTVHRLLQLPASIRDAGQFDRAELEAGLARLRDETREEIDRRNSTMFRQESEKLDGWAEDQRRAHRKSLDDLDRQSREIRREANEANSLPDQLALRKKLRQIDAERDRAWREFEDRCREIDEKRDELEEDACRLIESSSERTPLFTVTWSVV